MNLRKKKRVDLDFTGKNAVDNQFKKNSRKNLRKFGITNPKCSMKDGSADLFMHEDG